MEKINVINMMNMPLCVQSHILATLGLGENKAWEYNPSDGILIMDLHNCLSPLVMTMKTNVEHIRAYSSWGG
jgi:hypothetical protein